MKDIESFEDKRHDISQSKFQLLGVGGGGGMVEWGPPITMRAGGRIGLPSYIV